MDEPDEVDTVRLGKRRSTLRCLSGRGVGRPGPRRSGALRDAGARRRAGGTELVHHSESGIAPHGDCLYTTRYEPPFGLTQQERRQRRLSVFGTSTFSETKRLRPGSPVAVGCLAFAWITVREVLNGIGRLGFRPARGRPCRVVSRPARRHVRETDRRLFPGRCRGARAMADKRWCGKPHYDCVPDAFVVATASTRRLTVVTRDTE